MTTSPIEALQARLGHRFQDVELLERALTHRSFVNELGSRGPTTKDNQRLELLGDAVLGLVITDCLFDRFPTFDEGKLSKMKAQLVCESALAPAAEAVGLGEALRLGRGEEAHGGRAKPSVLADAYEAVIAALYLDGGLEAARRFILRQHHAALEAVIDPQQWQNPKTTLQEAVQSARGVRPTYEIVEIEGPPHLRRFTAHVLVDGQRLGAGEGKSKKEAQQNAAVEALTRLQAAHSHATGPQTPGAAPSPLAPSGGAPSPHAPLPR